MLFNRDIDPYVFQTLILFIDTLGFDVLEFINKTLCMPFPNSNGRLKIKNTIKAIENAVSKKNLNIRSIYLNLHDG